MFLLWRTGGHHADCDDCGWCSNDSAERNGDVSCARGISLDDAEWDPQAR